MNNNINIINKNKRNQKTYNNILKKITIIKKYIKKIEIDNPLLPSHDINKLNNQTKNKKIKF